jgi:hypothetical protein
MESFDTKSTIFAAEIDVNNIFLSLQLESGDLSLSLSPSKLGIKK